MRLFLGRNRRLLNCLQLLGVFFVAVSSTGCMSYLVGISYLVGGPPSVEPDFDKVTKLSMTAKDKTALVVCTAPIELRYKLDNIDDEVAEYVARRLNTHHIKVFDPDVVRNWLDRHDDWDRPEEIGDALKADYVIVIDLHKYSLFAENSVNLYQGQGECLVSVIEMSEDGSGERIYNKEIISKYPLAIPREASETSYSTFKRQFLSRFSEEIGRLFYEYYNGDDIADAS